MPVHGARSCGCLASLNGIRTTTSQTNDAKENRGSLWISQIGCVPILSSQFSHQTTVPGTLLELLDFEQLTEPSDKWL